MNVWEEAGGHFFLKEGVEDLGLFAFLPSLQDGFARVFSEEYGSVLFSVKVLFGNLFSIEEGQNETVGEDGAKFFHKVEGERESSGAGLV